MASSLEERLEAKLRAEGQRQDELRHRQGEIHREMLTLQQEWTTNAAVLRASQERVDALQDVYLDEDVFAELPPKEPDPSP